MPDTEIVTDGCESAHPLIQSFSQGRISRSACEELHTLPLVAVHLGLVLHTSAREGHFLEAASALTRQTAVLLKRSRTRRWIRPTRPLIGFLFDGEEGLAAAMHEVYRW